ncbi:hypothetical protein NP233_g8729 [Leucocoprinus birnbaumii]|uniref:Uncharacterized protein n=1 Tax=Leucocoprinus birnbaumii TaxID=56174 RepID=A0AAD5VNG8_9AGAR|nr:hypothetical protein NP233_g8729 [Leucocoprinus birnbaumii]
MRRCTDRDQNIHNLKAALDNAELENLVDELLTRNQRALVRLQELQIDRLSQPNPSTVDETSEEWQIAHGILESLETLISLRPRASSDDDDHFLSIIPPSSVLRKLHKTLALEPHPGWRGNLPETRATALRDDSTVKVRAAPQAAAVPAQTTAAAAPAAAASTSSSPAPTSITPAASTAAPTTTPYAGYTYAYSAQQAQAYRPAAGASAAAAYTPYKTGATSYYQNYLQSAQAQPQYYGQQAYGAGAANQQPYAAYTNWFAHAQQYAAAAANSAATGRGTPQPATATAAYGYYQQPAVAQQQQRPAAPATAVANTAAMNKTASVSNGVGVPGVWGGYAMGQQPTLPARTAPATTATPVATNGVYQAPQQQSYYGAYQTPQQPAATQQSAAR